MGTVTYDFEGETVIVTGGSSGIGRQIALGFGGAGATVLNADIREDPVDKDATVPTHEVIADESGDAEFVETDVSRPEQLQAVVERAREYGGVDVMVNNAGINISGSLREVTLEEFQEVQAATTRGVLFGTQAAAEDMIERSASGSVINTASIRSTFAASGQALHDTAKGAIRMLTRYAAFELADHGIRVNAVAPGPIATDGRTSEDAEELRERIARGDYTKPIPLGRAGEPEEVAEAVLFLASESASYTTGELLYVDGGYQVY